MFMDQQYQIFWINIHVNYGQEYGIREESCITLKLRRECYLRSICIQNQFHGPIPRGLGPARRLTLLSRNKRVSRKMRPAGSMGDVQEEVIFSLAANGGKSLPLFTKGHRRPLSLRSPGDASRNGSDIIAHSIFLTVRFESTKIHHQKNRR